MKTLIPAAIRWSLMFTAVTASLCSVRPALAYSVTLQQMGSNVVANGSGAVNLMGLIFQGSTTGTITGIRAKTGSLGTGPLVQLNSDVYTGFTGPTSFGSGVGFLPNTGSGDFVGIFGAARIAASTSRNAVSFSSARTLLRGYHEIKLTTNPVYHPLQFHERS